MNKFTAVIPVRENNNQAFVPNKDYLFFGGKNLLTYKLEQLKYINNVDILVVTESDFLADMAMKEGVKVLRRSKELSQNEVPFDELVRFVASNVKSEYIIWTCVTAPLVNEWNYREAIDLFLKEKENGYDSLISVKKLQRYILDDNGALNFKTGRKMKPIETLPMLYIFTNGISIARTKDMQDWGYTCGDIPYLYKLNKKEAIDICDEFDYKCALYFQNEEQNI